MASIFSAILRWCALRHNRCVTLWLKVARPTSEQWTHYLRRHGRLHRMGDNCHISSDTIFTDPEYTAIGSNVRIAGAWISGHDGSINMLEQGFGVKVDAVGPVMIHDNVFIGVGSRILPRVSIGPNAIVGAGSVITRDVPPNSVVAGNPARVIRSLEEHIEVTQRRSEAYPWIDLIKTRKGGFDPQIEPELVRRRVDHFYGQAETARRLHPPGP